MEAQRGKKAIKKREMSSKVLRYFVDWWYGIIFVFFFFFNPSAWCNPQSHDAGRLCMSFVFLSLFEKKKGFWPRSRLDFPITPAEAAATVGAGTFHLSKSHTKSYLQKTELSPPETSVVHTQHHSSHTWQSKDNPEDLLTQRAPRHRDADSRVPSHFSLPAFAGWSPQACSTKRGSRRRTGVVPCPPASLRLSKAQLVTGTTSYKYPGIWSIM